MPARLPVCSPALTLMSTPLWLKGGFYLMTKSSARFWGGGGRLLSHQKVIVKCWA